MTEVKSMDIAEFRRLGLLQEVNRQFFHPRGLALEVYTAVDGTMQLGGIWDCRDDDEGVVYSTAPLPAKGKAAEELYREKAKHRRRRFGWIVQPLGGSPPFSTMQDVDDD